MGGGALPGRSVTDVDGSHLGESRSFKRSITLYNIMILNFISSQGVLGFWGFGVLGLGFRV